MAKKPTEKQLYKLKNEWLGQFFEEVKPKEFYRAVFPEGSFERKGHFEDGKANGIITIVENDKAKNRIVFDDLSVIDEVKGGRVCCHVPCGVFRQKSDGSQCKVAVWDSDRP